MLANGEVFAGYVIERQLGRGGMGSVYLAKHPRLPRMTALKLLNREMFFDKEVRARFEREADLVARLDHPNIVTVYDRGIEEEQLWISMQYVDGIDAASVEPQTLPPERAVQIIKETADALDYAHGMGVLHRDVKPANILLARSTAGRGERVYLTDFGIARLRDDTGHLTQTGTFTATLAYASPEQLTGATLDHRSDQYSLACTLFWLFTGSGPFAATNPAQVIQGHLQSAPPALSSARPGLSYALDGVLAKAMAKRPDDRFESCSAFAAAAQHALSNPSTPSLPLVGGPVPHPQSTGPRPVTGNQMSGAPMTGAPYPTQHNPYASGAAPLTAGPAMAPPLTAQNPQQSNPYTHQQAVGYNPVPPPPNNYPPYGPAQQQQPPRKNNTTLIVGIIVGVVVLLAAVIGIGVVASQNSAGNGGTTTTTAASGPKITPSADAISKEFPRMVPASSDEETGYNNATCWETDTSYTPSPNDGDPEFGSWAWQWRCYGGGDSDDPFYRIYAYNSAADVQSVVAGLPANTKSTDTNGGKQYTNYKYSDNGNKIITVFSGDPDRSQFLMFTDGYGTPEEVLSWWRSAPLN
ncbi:serine/threonine-protein kinase [Nocardia asteroides]|uniref:serine/threonine-protein kinase n=1 Tax=Nocardia asteroides TaxID=1824 RepID=UPI001E43E4C7|nr:serine/threonine-protein kinase [Nocardia asteroides]UGT64153.1 protein kinase [Nocardia asteroides]